MPAARPTALPTPAPLAAPLPALRAPGDASSSPPPACNACWPGGLTKNEVTSSSENPEFISASSTCAACSCCLNVPAMMVLIVTSLSDCMCAKPLDNSEHKPVAHPFQFALHVMPCKVPEDGCTHSILGSSTPYITMLRRPQQALCTLSHAAAVQ